MKSEMQTAYCGFIGMEGSNNWGSVLGAARGYPSMLGPIFWGPQYWNLPTWEFSNNSL